MVASTRRASRGAAAARKDEVHFEFFGPWIGPLALLAGLPGVCYGLVWACNAGGCASLSPAWAPGFPAGQRFFSWQAVAVVLAWIAGQAALHLALPGPRALGAPLADGSRLEYKLTGFRNLAATLALLYVGHARLGVIDLAWLYHNYVPLLTAAWLVSTALAAYLYARARAAPRGALAAGGATGAPLYDFFIGRELNPRLLGGRLDLKEFCELYPGLIGWLALDLGCAAHQAAAAGAVSPGMAAVLAFQGLYVADALWHERAILTTIDITTDGFGWMLAFGDLAWVPFTYSLQARVLADHAAPLGAAALAAVVALKAVGYWAFRGANSQKDLFRRDPGHPAVRGLKTLATRRGTRLIVSGWWGVARHINYFGDWLMGLAWCLPAGAALGVVPYFYAVYFGALLLHRERRDEAACKAKYGADWGRYCAAVRWRIVPFVY